MSTLRSMRNTVAVYTLAMLHSPQRHAGYFRHRIAQTQKRIIESEDRQLIEACERFDPKAWQEFFA